jgi:DNA-binding response OmpR family regulator
MGVMKSGPQLPTSEKKTVVLVVDDHPSILRFIQTGLEIRGLTAITTTSGEEALKLAELADPDIILLDVVMPVTSGFDVLRRLRSSSPVPVIVFSANLEARSEAMALGANDFVTKPFNTDDMVTRIRSLLAKRSSPPGPRPNQDR